MTNKEVIELYGNRPEVAEELMSYLLLTFREDPHQNTIDCVKKYMKTETLCDNLVNVIKRDEINDDCVIDAEFKEIEEIDVIDDSKYDDLANDDDWA